MPTDVYVHKLVDDQILEEHVANPTLDLLKGLDYGNAAINWMLKQATLEQFDGLDVLVYRGSSKDMGIFERMLLHLKNNGGAYREGSKVITSSIMVLGYYDGEKEYLSRLSIDVTKGTTYTVRVRLSLHSR